MAAREERVMGDGGCRIEVDGRGRLPCHINRPAGILQIKAFGVTGGLGLRVDH